MLVHVLINYVLFSGVFCAAQETRSDNLPAHLPPFLHALDVVVGRELCTRWAILLPIWVSQQIFTWMTHAVSVDVTCSCVIWQISIPIRQELLHVLMVFVNKALGVDGHQSVLLYSLHCVLQVEWAPSMPWSTLVSMWSCTPTTAFLLPGLASRSSSGGRNTWLQFSWYVYSICRAE